MSRWDKAGDYIRALMADGLDPMEAAVRHIQATTGMSDRKLIEKVLQGKDIYSVTPDDVYRAGAEAKLGIKLGPSLGAPKEYVPPVRASEAGPPPQSFESRVQSDPEIRKTISEYDPSLADSVSGADSEAILDAYRQAAANEGVRPPSLPREQRVAESIAEQFDSLLPEPPRAVVRSEAPDAGWKALVDDWAVQRPLAVDTRGQLAMRRRGTISDGPLMDEALDDMSMRPATPRAPAPPKKTGRGAAIAAGAAGIGAGLALLPDDEQEITSGGEADLAEETTPAPAVAATPEPVQPTVKQAPADYSLQARALINRLNDMRRAAGGEVPEAPAMMKEINRLVAMGNEQRRSPQYSYSPQDAARDPYQQARELIAQVNQMYRQGATPNSPQVQQIMQRVRQLQAEGDAIRNRRAG